MQPVSTYLLNSAVLVRLVPTGALPGANLVFIVQLAAVFVGVLEALEH
jgi:hypothetical protein